jgi:hypothetical protein
MALGMLRRDPAARRSSCRCCRCCWCATDDHQLPAMRRRCSNPATICCLPGRVPPRFAQNLTLDNRNVLDYVLTGRDAPGWLWSLLSPV